jgi:hypothetical protein
MLSPHPMQACTRAMPAEWDETMERYRRNLEVAKKNGASKDELNNIRNTTDSKLFALLLAYEEEI